MKTYVTFGQNHVHHINGKVFDKDCVAIVQGDREKVFELFGPKFCFEYPQDMWNLKNTNAMKYFPRGYMNVEDDAGDIAVDMPVGELAELDLSQAEARTLAYFAGGRGAYSPRDVERDVRLLCNRTTKARSHLLATITCHYCGWKSETLSATEAGEAFAEHIKTHASGHEEGK